MRPAELTANAPAGAPGSIPPRPRNLKLVRWIAFTAILCVVFIALLWAAVASVIRADRQQEIESVYRETANLARAFEEHVRRTIQYADQFALQAKRLQERSGRELEWTRLMEQIGRRDEAVPLLSVADENGEIVRSNLPFTPVNIGDRAHFRAHVSKDSGELHVGKPVIGRVSKQWTIQLTRRVNKPDGAFGGVITVGLGARYFSHFYRRLDLGERGSVALIGRDGIVRARQSGMNETPGQDVADSNLMRLAAAASEGSFYSPGKIDDVPRHISYRVLPDYPLIVLVGRAADEALAGIAQRERHYLQIATVATLLALALGIAVTLSLVRDQRAMRRRAVLREEREQAHAAQLASETRHRLLIESTPIAIVTTRHGVILYANPAAVSLFGARSATDLIGRNNAEFVHADQRDDVRTRTEQLNREPTELPKWEFRLQTVHGNWFDAEVSSISFMLEGQLTVQNTIRDISERKRYQTILNEQNAQLERGIAERTAQLEAANEELEAFSYSVSHDLRAPLRAITGFGRILAEHLGDRMDADARHCLDRIDSGVKRMGELIDSLMRFAHSSRVELKLDCVELAALAAAAAAEANPAYPQAAIFIGRVPNVRGDATLLHEVLANLIDNALKYSSKSPQPRVEIGHLPGEHGGEFFVRDNGAGFDSRFAHNLFTPFRRLHNESEFPGTGIGLALCKRIVERHGGRIRAESVLGEGTCVYFSLPADECPDPVSPDAR